MTDGQEEPFIPSVESISEDVDLESATLYTVPEKVDGYTEEIDERFIDNSLPNPFSSKALGVNLQNRQALRSSHSLHLHKQNNGVMFLVSMSTTKLNFYSNQVITN